MKKFLSKLIISTIVLFSLVSFTFVQASDLYPALGALTGGGTGALDKIDGAGLSDGDAAIVILSTGSYHYHLNATSGATEDSPEIISPDTNAGTKRWVLVIPMGPMSHVRAVNSSTSIANSSATTVVWGTEKYDLLGEYNNSTGYFTAIYAGTYSVTYGVTFASTSWTAGNLCNVDIQPSSPSDHSVFSYRIPVTATYEHAQSHSAVMELAAGATIDVYIWQNSGGAKSLSGNADNNWITIDRLP